jgi:hypothetical protein
MKGYAMTYDEMVVQAKVATEPIINDDLRYRAFEAILANMLLLHTEEICRLQRQAEAANRPA